MSESARMAGMGVEPTNTAPSGRRLFRFAYPAASINLSPRDRTGSTGPGSAGWTPATPENRRGETRTPTPRKARAPEARASAIPPPGVIASSIQRTHRSSTGGSRTHRHEDLSPAALPVCVPCRPFILLRTPAPSMGFEPTTSTVTGWRALRAAPRGRMLPSSLREWPGRDSNHQSPDPKSGGFAS